MHKQPHVSQRNEARAPANVVPLENCHPESAARTRDLLSSHLKPTADPSLLRAIRAKQARDGEAPDALVMTIFQLEQFCLPRAASP
jgi:hypothetical protein